MFHVKHSKSNLVIWFVFSRNYLRETRLKPSPLPPGVRSPRARVPVASIPSTESVARTLWQGKASTGCYYLLHQDVSLYLPSLAYVLPSLAYVLPVLAYVLPFSIERPGRRTPEKKI